MARIRTIKPEFWTDSLMVQLPPLARLIYIALWTAADDHGLIPDEPERLAMEVMPRENALVFDDWLQFFEAVGRIDRYYAPDGSNYFRIGKWELHQRVDKPSKSRVAREGSRKLAIPLAVRRQVAGKYGCQPGESKDATCFYCGTPGSIHWHRLSSGRPSAWVTFPGLELDHVEPEHYDGQATVDNIVLACRGCNRSKRFTEWIAHLCMANSVPTQQSFAKPREDSGTEGKGKEQGKERNREEEQSSLHSDLSTAAPNDNSPDPVTTTKTTPPSDIAARRAQRLAAVTDEAIAAYNRILGKPNGRLRAVRASVGRKTRQDQVQRCLQVAAEICLDTYGDKRVTPTFWDAHFGACSDDPFTSGEGPYSGEHANWRPDFEYLTRKATVLKVFEKATDDEVLGG
jgi:hypothetical protein